MTEREHAAVCDAAVTLAFSVFGKRWNGMILSSLASGPMSFVVLRRAVTGIGDTVLSDRLVELAEAGLIRRRVASQSRPVTVTYELTEAGSEVIPTIEQLGAWARRNLAVERQPGGI